MRYLQLLARALLCLLLSAAAQAQTRSITETAGPLAAPQPEPVAPAAVATAEQPQPTADEPSETDPPPTSEPLSEGPVSRDELRRCLAYYFFRPETASRCSPWSLMHSLIGFGVDTRVEAADKDYSAIGWLCANQPCQGLRLFRLDNGKISAPIAAGYQGHEGQFLHMLAFSRVPRDYPLQIDGHDFTLADLIAREQRTCRSGTELTFKLAAFVHYLPSDATWQNESGETWSIERLIQEELAQPVNGAACGGTHRLMGLGYAVRKRLERGEPLTGQWTRAQQAVTNHVAQTYRQQNADGSFSTNWFVGPGNSAELKQKLNTTGHTLEWLLMTLPKEQLRDPRLLKATQCLTALLWNNRERTWEIGPRGHALHALALIDERLFGGQPGQRSVELAAARDDNAGPIAGGPQADAGSTQSPTQPTRRTGPFGRGRR